MNIDELTIGLAKELAAMFAKTGEQPEKQKIITSLTGQKVIVRATGAGVNYGTLESIVGDTVTLSDARRLWYWVVAGKAGISLSDVAEYGVAANSKICAVVPTQIIIGACEVMSTTTKAQQSIEGADVYRP